MKSYDCALKIPCVIICAKIYPIKVSFSMILKEHSD